LSSFSHRFHFQFLLDCDSLSRKHVPLVVEFHSVSIFEELAFSL
jgi:hypothetical protein